MADGVLVEPPTDQYLLPHFPGHQNTRIYPLKGPDLRTARKLAKGHRRGGKAVLYTSTSLGDVARAEILKRNLQAIGLELEVKQFPAGLILGKLATPGEPWDIGRVLYFVPPDPGYLNSLFDGRTIGQPESANCSSFNSPKYNRLLDRASRLTGEERYRAYGELDVLLSRDAAPRIPVSGTNLFTFVSPRVGCVVLNGFGDLALTAVMPQVTRALAATPLRAACEELGEHVLCRRVNRHAAANDAVNRPHGQPRRACPPTGSPLTRRLHKRQAVALSVLRNLGVVAE